MHKLEQRGVVHLLVPLILLAGIVVGVYLIQTGNLKLFPKATNPPIVFKSSTGQALPTNSSGIPQTTSATIKIELTSTLGPPVTAYTYPTPYGYPTPSYETPSYGTPSYGTPSYGTPSYGTPSYSYPTPITPSPTPTAMRVFVTSTNYNGNLGGLSGADQKCQARANAANLGGTWKAWLSDSRTSASLRLNHYNGPYKNLQNSILVSNWVDLIDGSDGPRISVDEFKSTKTGYAWTNTNFNGDLIATTNTIGGANGHCADWVSTTPTISGGVGSIDNNSYNTQWTSITVISCSQQASLYCFEQPTSGVQGVTAGSYSTPSSVSGPIPTGTVSYKIAENPTDLTNKTAVPYAAHPTILDYTFQDSSLGQKFIWVEFIGSDGTTDRRSAQIEIVSASPSPSPSPSPIPYTYPTPPIPTPTPSPSPTPRPSPSPTPTPSPRFVRITYPNGGETLTVGQTVNVRWEHRDINFCYLGYSFGLGSLNNIARVDVPASSTTGSYNWTVNIGNTTNTQVKMDILCYKTGVGSVSDQSDNFFTVLRPTPTPTPTPTPRPSPTPTPSPSATPRPSPSPTPTPTPQLTIRGFIQTFRSQRGDTRYNPLYDANNDGRISIIDFSILRQRLRR